MKTFKPLHILSGDLWGGAEAQVHLLCKGISESHLEQVMPSALLLNHGTLEDKLTTSKIATKIAGEKNGFLSIINSAYKFAKTQKCNLIISHGYKEAFVGFIISKLLCLPWIHVIHGTSENYTGAKKYKMFLYSYLERFFMRASASRIVTVSKKIAIDLGIENLSKHRVIYNAAESRNNNDLLKNTKSKQDIAWLGRLSPVKRPDLAILGFKYFLENSTFKNSSTRLNIYGTGPLEAEIKELCKELPQINLNGFTDEPEKVISESTLLLLTSDSEGIPTVILEAMHLKIPIISRFVGGIPEILSIVPSYPIVEIENGSTIACGLAIERALLRLTELQSLAKESNTDFFKVSRLIDDHLKLYRELI